MRAAYECAAFFCPLHALTVTKAVVWRRVLNAANAGDADARACAAALASVLADRRGALPGVRAPFDRALVPASALVRARRRGTGDAARAPPTPRPPAAVRRPRELAADGGAASPTRGARAAVTTSVRTAAHHGGGGVAPTIALHSWRVAGDRRVGARVLLPADADGGSGEGARGAAGSPRSAAVEAAVPARPLMLLAQIVAFGEDAATDGAAQQDSGGGTGGGGGGAGGGGRSRPRWFACVRLEPPPLSSSNNDDVAIDVLDEAGSSSSA